MRYLIKLLIVFCLIVSCMTIQAQKTIPTTGGNATGAGGSISYTVGQVVYTTNSGTTGTVTHGVQQPYEISIITSLEEAKDINISCIAYPNPTSDFLILKIENYDGESLSYKLLDINGILLQNKKVTGNETTIDMSSISSAIYFLIIADYNKELKSFKIIKN